MNALRFACLLSLLAPASVFAADAYIRVTCDESEKGSEVLVDGEYKGKCPIDVTTRQGPHKLEFVAKVNGNYAFVYTTEVVLGSGVMQKIEVPSLEKTLGEWTSWTERETPLPLLIRSAKSSNPVAKAELQADYLTDPKGCYFRFWYPKSMKGSISSWTGACMEGAGSGPGELVWTANGIPAYVRFSGNFIQGRLKGKGTSTYHDGQSFTGMFVDGRESKPGIRTYSNGDRYEIDSAGKGILFKNNGDRYEGTVSDGKMHGNGVLIRADGTRIVGRFDKDKFTGPN